MYKGYLSWFSPPVGDKQGFGYAAVNLIEALMRKGIRVDYNSETPHTHISWVQPPWYEGRDFQYRVGYSPWESSKLPGGWLSHMNSCDEIWTPTSFCKEVFEEGGVERPITVVPHGHNFDDYPVQENVPGGPFTFFHVGAPTGRKGAQRVFDAFLELFDGNKDVRLLMKSWGPSDARYIDKYDTMHNINYHPQVQVYEVEADVSVMRDLYNQAHCMVYPSNGEGFGFIPFQSIAMGIPTIATNGTGMRDFAYMSYPLNWSWEEGNGLHIGNWCNPNHEHLKELMLHVYNNYDAARKKTLTSSQWIKENQTWDHVADQILGILGKKVLGSYSDPLPS